MQVSADDLETLNANACCWKGGALKGSSPQNSCDSGRSKPFSMQDKDVKVANYARWGISVVAKAVGLTSQSVESRAVLSTTVAVVLKR